MDDARWEIERYLVRQKIDKSLFSEQMLDDIAYQYYKNYYDYEMDEEYAALAVVSVVLKENGQVLHGQKDCGGREWLFQPGPDVGSYGEISGIMFGYIIKAQGASDRTAVFTWRKRL